MTNRLSEMESDDKQGLGNGIIDAENIIKNRTAMLKAIRSLGSWSLGLGVMEIIAFGNIDATTGILLVIVGLTSLWFHTSDIFTIYVVTLTWTAIYNFSTMQIGWILIGFFKVYLVFNAFQNHRRYRGFSDKYAKLVTINKNDDSEKYERTARLLPWSGFILSCFSAVGVVLSVILGSVISSITGNNSPPLYFGFLVSIVVSSGILGLSFSLASLLSGYRPKLIVIFGMLLGGVMLVFFLATLVTS